MSEFIFPASATAGYLDRIDPAALAALAADDPNVAAAADIVDDPETAIGTYADDDAQLDAERAIDLDSIAGGDDQIGDGDQIITPGGP